MKKYLLGFLIVFFSFVSSTIVYAHEPLMVFAAASLKNALQEIAGDFKEEYRADINFNFGGSSALRVQIEKGAPCDIFFAADKASTEKLSAQKIIEQKSLVNLLRNQLIIVSDPKNEENFTSLYDLHLADADHLAIADPKTAPAGVYAMQALKKAGLDEKFKDFIVPTLDVRAALALVQSGNAKYAIVYFSDARNAANVKILYQIPEQLYDPIIYTAGIIKNSANPVPAQNFLSFLQTDQCKMIFQKYGFQSF